ncbi:MAG: copper resistance protein CopC [Actinobacteria bacterium]|nr:copper resistance protein CopC [Actinomycetota bacterium]
MRRLLVSLAVATLTVLSIPCASAHGEIVAAYPEQYSNVTPIPTQAWIEFDGTLQRLEGQAINSIEVLDSTGLTISYGDPIIEGGKISTKLSGQAAAGVFTVNYRIVSEDGHPVEGSYTFNASPDYAEAVPATTSVLEKKSSFNFGGLAAIAIVVLFGVGVLVKRKSEKK